MTKQQITDWVNRLDEKGSYALAIWTYDDVIGRAEEKGKTIDEDTAREIIEKVHCKQDCSIGINWDVLDYYIEEDG